MGYDLALAERIREVLSSTPGVSERKMFGGLAFLVDGHMTVAASGHGGLMLRVDPTTSDSLVDTTPAVYAEMRGRTMKGWIRLAASDVATDDVLQRWIDKALTFTSTLPPK